MKRVTKPTKYEEGYDEQLIAHMSTGMSYESFAGLIGVNRDTLYHWETLQETWLESKKIGREKQLLANEQRIHDMAKGKLKNGNVTAQIFILKNCHKWSDRHEVEIPNAAISLNVSRDEANL